ncbi:expressed unknown protein [Seminavis robusta]|uniref:Uncharacterized protein n=1 Tax=Seminavis robusta TaxID=568900 RepID=A0A9N8HND0_9STRA|nr:expressed unknown protein [Seminavis robusta]|eukprot:Sro1072_g238120.1 n/a (153) ;mRNA; f:30085-30543
MGSRMSCSSACTVSSDLTLYSSDEEDMDLEEEEEASIPEARPIASTDEDPEMLERVSQLEQEMKRLQDELRQQQQQNLKQQSAQPFKFRQPSSELASSSEEPPNTATIDDQIAHAQFVQAFRASIKVKNRKYHLKSTRIALSGEKLWMSWYN